MPTLSMFYGIIVKMYKEKGGKHNKPHIHAQYNENIIVVDLEGNILDGKLPKKQLTFLSAWMLLHHDELVANWQLVNETGEFFKIEPLK